tara:strand:+ start:189 stop:383 length:195 start_codon:yes stop_codon:yes gene_type:complete
LKGEGLANTLIKTRSLIILVFQIPGLVILVSGIIFDRRPFWRDHFGVNLKMNDHFTKTFENIRP